MTINTMRASSAVAASIIAMTLVCAAMLALPGRTVTAAFINDVMIFLDGAHRISVGQVPSRDFHSALGPLVFYIPAGGYLLTRDLGAALPAGMALFMVTLLPLLVHVLRSRLLPVLAIGLGAFLILILAAPINLGGPISALTFAMFYNRIGWVALGLLLVMYLRPREHRTTHIADAVTATVLILLQLYTKATYAAVGVAFLLLLLLDRQQRRWAGASLLAAACAVVAIEGLWGGTRQYVSDLLAAAQVSGDRDSVRLVRLMLQNLADVTVFALIAGVSLRHTRRWQDSLFYGFCAAMGLLIIQQNAHSWGIITLYCGAAVAAELACRADAGLAPGHQPQPPGLTAGLPLVFIALLLPPVVHHSVVLTRHAALAAANAGSPVALPKFVGLRYIEPENAGSHFISRYLEGIGRGGDLLQALPDPERVVVLDFVNPFSAGLGLRPPRGDSAWLHWGRNVDARTHLAPDVLLADAQFVMVPKIGINSAPLQDIYGAYIRERFDLRQDTEEWIFFERKAR